MGNHKRKVAIAVNSYFATIPIGRTDISPSSNKITQKNRLCLAFEFFQHFIKKILARRE